MPTVDVAYEALVRNIVGNRPLEVPSCGKEDVSWIHLALDRD
jgi:hypothetical protein